MKLIRVIKYAIKKGFSFTYDTNYGIDKRNGWTITVNGVICAELKKHLFTALYYALITAKQLEHNDRYNKGE